MTQETDFVELTHITSGFKAYVNLAQVVYMLHDGKTTRIISTSESSSLAVKETPEKILGLADSAGR